MEEKRKRRRWTKEFKLEAVRMLEEGSLSGAEVLRKLGVTREHLYRWRDEVKNWKTEAFRGNGNRTSDQERIRELEAENRRLRMERDFLKKNSSLLCKGRVVKYSAIRHHAGEYPVRLMCRVLGVTPSG